MNINDYYTEIVNGCDPSSGELGQFLKDNFWLIVDVAKKRFGRVFDIREIVSDASAAYFRMKDYHARYQPTKETSSYTWFLHKEFDKSARVGVTTGSGRLTGESNVSDSETSADDILLDRNSHKSFYSDRSEPVTQEELIFHDSLVSDLDMAEDELTDAKMDQKVMPYGARYTVCIESFKKLRSANLAMILGSISEKKMKVNRRLHKSLQPGCRSINSLSERLRHRLLKEIATTGCNLYVGICLNGSCNNVLVAAKNNKEAGEYLRRYGRMIELRRINS